MRVVWSINPVRERITEEEKQREGEREREREKESARWCDVMHLLVMRGADDPRGLKNSKMYIRKAARYDG